MRRWTRHWVTSHCVARVARLSVLRLHLHYRQNDKLSHQLMKYWRNDARRLLNIVNITKIAEFMNLPAYLTGNLSSSSSAAAAAAADCPVKRVAVCTSFIEESRSCASQYTECSARCLGGVTVRASNLRSSDRGFDSQSGCYQAT